MRKLITTFVAVLAVSVAVGLTSSVAVANAASCSVGSAGGEKVPGIDSTTVFETGTQGYKCTVAWDADVQPQYEAGGTWHYCVECAPGFHPNTPDQFFPANCVFNWPHTGPASCETLWSVEPDYNWTPTAAADTPTCSVNWRLQVNFFKSGGMVFQTNNSPQLAKTC